MKGKFLFIAMSAIVLFAVQGYAQEARGREMQRYNTKTRSEKSYSSSQSQTRRDKSRPNYSRKGKPKQDNYRSDMPVGMPYRPGVQQRNHVLKPYSVTPPPQPQRKGWKPEYKHHESYRHHHYDCVFDSWTWIKWRGYTNRFIRHMRYDDRYFDAMLGYYLWGDFEAPVRISVGDMVFERYFGQLKVSLKGKDYYFSLYQNQKLSFYAKDAFIDITTGKGFAKVHLYDEYGNSATYRL